MNAMIQLNVVALHHLYAALNRRAFGQAVHFNLKHDYTTLY